jgi:hypothetical protein
VKKVRKYGTKEVWKERERDESLGRARFLYLGRHVRDPCLRRTAVKPVMSQKGKAVDRQWSQIDRYSLIGECSDEKRSHRRKQDQFWPKRGTEQPKEGPSEKTRRSTTARMGKRRAVPTVTTF